MTKLENALQLINEVRQENIKNGEYTDLLTFTSILLEKYDSKQSTSKEEIQKILNQFFE